MPCIFFEHVLIFGKTEGWWERSTIFFWLFWILTLRGWPKFQKKRKLELVFIVWILAMPGLKADGTGPFVLCVFVFVFFWFCRCTCGSWCLQHFILQAFAKTLNAYAPASPANIIWCDLLPLIFSRGHHGHRSLIFIWEQWFSLIWDISNSSSVWISEISRVQAAIMQTQQNVERNHIGVYSDHIDD